MVRVKDAADGAATWYDCLGQSFSIAFAYGGPRIDIRLGHGDGEHAAHNLADGFAFVSDIAPEVTRRVLGVPLKIGPGPAKHLAHQQ